MSVDLTRSTPLAPAARAQGLRAYVRADPPTPVRHWLDANESSVAVRGALAALSACTADDLSRYPDASPLERELAARHALSPDQLVVTAGGDDALARIATATLNPDDHAIGSSPTFELIPKYVRLAGASWTGVPWLDGSLPLDDTLRAITPRTRALFIVSPNNPTGLTIERDAWRRLRTSFSGLIVLDAAYAEFDDDDLSDEASRTDATIVVRTLSKAWGLAGLRVGYAMGDARVVDWLRRVGQPYSVSAVAIAVARRWLVDGQAAVADSVRLVKTHRAELTDTLRARGAHVADSRANFIFATFPPGGAAALHTHLLRRAIAVRRWPDGHELASSLRITCPADEPTMSALRAALAALPPT